MGSLPRRRRSVLRTLPLAVAVALAATTRPGAAAPPDAQRKACFSAYENVQVLMRRSHLREAREAASACLADRCPSALRGDCGQWLKDIESRMPSVVVECRTTDGKAITDARLLLDGAPFKDHPDGIVSEIDPGEHVIRVERAGAAPVDVPIIVGEGKKAQRIVVEVPGEAAADPAVPPPSIAPVLPAPEAARPAPVPVSFYVLAGIGALALGGFGFFAITGKDEERGLDRCSPRCSDDEVGDVRTRYIAADALLGVSVIALGAAAWVFFARGSSPRARTSSR